MQKQHKLFVVGDDIGYAGPFHDLFELTDNPKEATVAMFTGGEDVDPMLYGEARGRYTHCNKVRDDVEARYFDLFMDAGIPMVGICRGSQFLTVMSGGKLYQDVSDHAVCGGHNVTTKDGRLFEFTSTHHQMMKPWGTNHELIAWASDHLSQHYLDGRNIQVAAPEREPEIIYYPDTRCLCIQPHPEMMEFNSPGVEYCKELIREYLLPKAEAVAA